MYADTPIVVRGAAARISLRWAFRGPLRVEVQGRRTAPGNADAVVRGGGGGGGTWSGGWLLPCSLNMAAGGKSNDPSRPRLGAGSHWSSSSSSSSSSLSLAPTPAAAAATAAASSSASGPSTPKPSAANTAASSLSVRTPLEQATGASSNTTVRGSSAICSGCPKAAR